jgi:hypothetical protein
MVSAGPGGGKRNSAVADPAPFAVGAVASTLPAMFPCPTFPPWPDNSL